MPGILDHLRAPKNGIVGDNPDDVSRSAGPRNSEPAVSNNQHAGNPIELGASAHKRGL